LRYAKIPMVSARIVSFVIESVLPCHEDPFVRDRRVS
jgi:hypothetical protein